jgi:flavin-dependent dehydrogenase
LKTASHSDRIGEFNHAMQEDLDRADVTLIGGGLTGMAASLHLARAGYRVLCIEADADSNKIVGESLDWSAPALLDVLGLSMDRMIAEGIATYKRHVTVRLEDGSSQDYLPGEWLAHRPWNVELRTMHVDRPQLGRALRKIVLSHGVELAADRVVDVEREGGRVTAVSTALGRRISSRWFIDASGSSARLFPRAFQLPVHEYGPTKVGMWTYFSVPESSEGTTLYLDGRSPYMEWIWEIPIHPNVISVGYVAAGDAIKARRRQGFTVDEILRERLARIPRFEGLLRAPAAMAPQVTSFQCRVHGGLVGPNWLVVGEAASMVDPMTSNGVTAALRHAAEASALIIRFGHRPQLPLLARKMYSKRIVDLSRFFNCGIEKTIYDPAIRNRVGVLNAGRAYTIAAWSLNAAYSRLRPEGTVSTVIFGFVLNLFRAASVVCWVLCKRLEGARKVAG